MTFIRAEELFKEFRETSIVEFFRKNKAHLGYAGKVRSFTTVVHELVTNSLDACEEALILPELHLRVEELGEEHYSLVAKDNGPGIPAKYVPEVFGKMLAGTKFHRNVQLRGQQGIGVSGVTLFSQMTTGNPIRVKTSTGNGRVYEFELTIDVAKNRANVLREECWEEEWRGCEVEVELKGASFSYGEKGPYEYLRRTAIANPHASITFVDPEGKKHVFERSTEVMPRVPIAVKLHPAAVEADDLYTLARQSKARNAASFLTSVLCRLSEEKLRELSARISFSLEKSPRSLSWKECEELARELRQMKFMAPPSKGLIPIGEEQIERALISIIKPEFWAVVMRPPKAYAGGIPFQIEVALAYGGKAGREGNGPRVEIMRFGNRAPLLFDSGACVLTKAVNSINWKRYDIPNFEESPLTLVLSLVSTYIPYTSAGKQSVAAIEEIHKEARMALMEAARGFKRYSSRKHRIEQKRAKQRFLLMYGSELAVALAELTDQDANEVARRIEELIGAGS